MAHFRINTDRRIPKYRVATCHSAALSTTNPKLTTLGFISDLHYNRPTANILNHDKLCCILLYNMKYNYIVFDTQAILTHIQDNELTNRMVNCARQSTHHSMFDFLIHVCI